MERKGLLVCILVYVNKKSPYCTVISVVSFPHYSSLTVVLTVFGVFSIQHYSSETIITILYIYIYTESRTNVIVW